MTPWSAVETNAWYRYCRLSQQSDEALARARQAWDEYYALSLARRRSELCGEGLSVAFARGIC